MTAKLAAKYTTTIATLRDQREAGATGLEYAGMIAVAALVVALIYQRFVLRRDTDGALTGDSGRKRKERR